MKLHKFFAWIAVVIGAIYFIVPLIGTLEFSLRMRRNAYSFDAYASVFSDSQFLYAFGYSMLMALLTIVFGMLLVVPTAYWVRLRLPQIRPIVEFITLMPLVIPAIVIVFGYLRLYNSSSILPLTGYNETTNVLLVCSYIVLSLPYMYRSVDTAMRTIDVGTLTEAAESLGAKWTTIMFKCIFPNVMSGVLSGAFITLAIVMGEFTMASLLNRPAFGPYMQLVGANQAYQSSALAIIALAVTWLSMGLLQLVSRFSRSAPIKA